MAGPYFKGQKVAPCGCFYPDVTRVRDDKERLVREYLCIAHGIVTRKLVDDREIDSDVPDVPTDEWREQERERLATFKDGLHQIES